MLEEFEIESKDSKKEEETKSDHQNPDGAKDHEASIEELKIGTTDNFADTLQYTMKSNLHEQINQPNDMDFVPDNVID